MQQQYPRLVGPVDQSVADLVFPANEVLSLVLLPLLCYPWAGPNSSSQYCVDYFVGMYYSSRYTRDRLAMTPIVCIVVCYEADVHALLPPPQLGI